MDYANRRRVKVWGTARVVEGDAGLLERLRDSAYRGQAERAIQFTVAAWDGNCQQHIHERYTRRQVAGAVAGLHKRIAELEAEVERLRSNAHANNHSQSGAPS